LAFDAVVNLNVKVFKLGPYLLPAAAQRVIGDLIPHRDFNESPAKRGEA